MRSGFGLVDAVVGQWTTQERFSGMDFDMCLNTYGVLRL